MYAIQNICTSYTAEYATACKYIIYLYIIYIYKVGIENENQLIILYMHIFLMQYHFSIWTITLREKSCMLLP